eukprot:2035088-Pyramimonas_sp.AAC.1
MSRPTVPSRAGGQGCGMHTSGSGQTGSYAATQRGACGPPRPRGDTARPPAKSNQSWSGGKASLSKIRGAPRSSSPIE